MDWAHSIVGGGKQRPRNRSHQSNSKGQQDRAGYERLSHNNDGSFGIFRGQGGGLRNDHLGNRSQPHHSNQSPPHLQQPPSRRRQSPRRPRDPHVHRSLSAGEVANSNPRFHHDSRADARDSRAAETRNKSWNESREDREWHSDEEGLRGRTRQRGQSTEEQVLERYFETVNKVPPFLDKQELEELFDIARRKFDVFGVRLTLNDISRVVEEKTFLNLVIQAKGDKARELKIGPVQEDVSSSGARSPASKITMTTPTLDAFLSEVSRIIRQNADLELQSVLLIEPKFPEIYETMIAEMRMAYPAGSEARLESKCAEMLPETQETPDGGTWMAFVKFISQYFVFLRDVNVDFLLETYYQLSELVTKCNSAFSHPSGILLLPTVVAYSKVLTRLAIGLEKRPELMVGVKLQSNDDGETVTLPERAANVIRSAYTACVQDRAGGPTGLLNGRPAGKKIGLYKLANLCLKILFQCKKARNTVTIFNSCANQSPSTYPLADRVTYLYYLGRFHFSMNHFYRATLALQAAYDACPRYNECQSQRRLILIYLVASNIILGRFPSTELYQKPEATGFLPRFQPLCRAISRGDLTTFRRLTSFTHEHAAWFIHHRIFLQLRNRCEVLVWRSLIRKTYLLHSATETHDPTSKNAPTISLDLLAHVFQYFEKRYLNPLSQTDNGPGNRHTNWIFMPPDPPPQTIYADAEFEDAGSDGYYDVEDPFLLPDVAEMESIVASLIDQGLLNGFISYKMKRFVISGARRDPALQAGFPNVWNVVSGRGDGDDVVPGWNRGGGEAGGLNGFGGGGGGVVHLSNVRPIGAV